MVVTPSLRILKTSKLSPIMADEAAFICKDPVHDPPPSVVATGKLDQLSLSVNQSLGVALLGL